MTPVEDRRLDQMEKKLDTMEGKLDKVLGALEDSDLNVDGGLITQFKDIKKRVTDLEAIKNKIVWMAVGAGFGGGITIVKLIQWIQEAAR